jgi:signal transduction histidine kinase
MVPAAGMVQAGPGVAPDGDRPRLPVPRFARDLKPFLAIGVVLVSLAVLAILPILIGREEAALDTEVAQVSEPFRERAHETRVALAREVAGARAYVLTGDTQWAREYRAARDARRRSVDDLMDLSHRSERDVEAVAISLPGTIGPGDAALDSALSGLIPVEALLPRLVSLEAGLDRAAESVRRVEVDAREGEVRRRALVARAERGGTAITVALVVLAAVASVLVGRLGLEYRALAVREAEARAEAERRHEEADRAGRSRAVLMRGFTHDVKSPLGAASGQLELIESGLGDPVASARKARRALSSAFGLIDGLLQLAQADSGTLVVHREPTDLGAEVRRTVDDYRILAEGKGLTLTVEATGRLPEVSTDPDRVRQILVNLISNAINYTRAGGIRVSVEAQPPDPGRGVLAEDRCVAICVRDTGPGLTEAQQALLFHEFRRLETSVGVEGTGLGLAISRRIAQALGGDIVVESQPGRGSTFTLLLPLDAPAVEADPS